jgi:hypothetical protein
MKALRMEQCWIVQTVLEWWKKDDVKKISSRRIDALPSVTLNVQDKQKKVKNTRMYTSRDQRRSLTRRKEKV